MKFPSRLLYCRLFAPLCILSLAACSSGDDPSPTLVAQEATDITTTGFKASWNAVAGASAYQLDVSADNFVTFIGDYNSKTVIETTETVTGLASGTVYKYRVRSLSSSGVSENSNEVTVTTSFGPVAKIDGTDFTPTDLTLTDTKVGLELRMKNATTDITFRLSDKAAGTYELFGGITASRIAATPKWSMAMWVSGGETYYGEFGSVAISVAADKTVSLTFTASGTNKNGKNSKIASGKIQNAVVAPAGVAQCALATYSPTNDGDTMTGSFGYDSEGRLIQFIADETMWNYFWTGSQITRAVYLSEYELRDEVWTYQNNLLTKITGVTGGFMGFGTFEITYTYTNGKLTKAVRADNINEVPFTYTNIISYSGDNVSSVEFDADFFGGSISHYTNNYSDYDSKNNFWQLLAKSTNNPLPIGFIDSVDGEMISKNNVGKISRPGSFGDEVTTYTYPAYSNSGYPTSFNYVDDEGEKYSVTLTYTGCN